MGAIDLIGVLPIITLGQSFTETLVSVEDNPKNEVISLATLSRE